MPRKHDPRAPDETLRIRLGQLRNARSGLRRHGKGWVKLGAGPLRGNSSIQINNIKLPAGVKRAGLCMMNDVLTTSIETSR